MSDSLRDQLLKAGFAEPKAKPKPARKHKPKAHVQSRNKSPDKQTSGQQGAATSSSNSSASGATSQQPRAGYTHVAPPVAKKKKKQKAPAVKARAGSWSTRTQPSANEKPRRTVNPQEQQAARLAAEKRKQMKAQIQGLIDAAALKQHKGEEIYRFTLQNKIRELLVSEPVRKQLVNGELAITRLNGATRIIPADTAAAIRNINPQWVIFISSDVAGSNDEDDEFPIPDDLIW